MASDFTTIERAIMYVKQPFTGYLAHVAYYIESNGEGAIIDPFREVQSYIDLASERGAKIKNVLDTHFHADFISGHVDLASRISARIVFGPRTMESGFEILVGSDNEELNEIQKTKFYELTEYVCPSTLL